MEGGRKGVQVKRMLFNGMLGAFLAAILIFSAGNSANAAIVLTNPGFENGLTGWTVSGSGTASTVTQLDGGSYIYFPQDGEYFLELDVPGKSSLIVYQDFQAEQGDTLRGWAGLVSPMYNPFDVASVLTIYCFAELVWWSPVSTKGWKEWEWTASSSGDYRLLYTLLNYGACPSIAVYDAPVPIPTTILLLASGLLGLIAISRRLRK
jgi:hypothetical protein